MWDSIHLSCLVLLHAMGQKTTFWTVIVIGYKNVLERQQYYAEVQLAYKCCV